MSISDVLQRLEEMEKKFDGKLSDINKKLDGIVLRVDVLEKRGDNHDGRLTALEKKFKELNAIEEQHKAAIAKTKRVGVMSEFKSKELNVIFEKIPQEDAKETMQESLKKVKQVIKDVLKVKEEVNITHAHRLPSGGTADSKPLIIKLASMMEKDKLWKNIGNVSKFNEDKEATEKRYVEMNHLPKKLFLDKMSLKKDFNAHKAAGKKPRWKMDKQNVEFCYVIGSIYYRPKCRPDSSD